MLHHSGICLYWTSEKVWQQAMEAGQGEAEAAAAEAMPAAYVPFGGLAPMLAGDDTAPPRWHAVLTRLLSRLDFAPDLAEEIGSPRWYRGFGVMVGLLVTALLFMPSLSPLQAASAMRLDAPAREQMSEITIAPLALGADTGSRMGPLAMVVPIASVPERPRINLVATFSSSDSFGRMLQRAGVGAGDAARAADLVNGAQPLGEIAPGTRVDITLGARSAPNAPRPLEHLALRARFDLAVGLNRSGAGFALSRHEIPVDATPLRIRGQVGRSIYLSARAAGAPMSAIQRYLQTIDAHLSLDSVAPGDTYDMILGYKRAADGTSEVGNLVYAGLEHAGRPRTQLMRWGDSGQFVDLGSLAATRVSTGLMMPVSNFHVSSPYGLRFHPILGYTRMHAGVDLAVPYGTPIHAVASGTVTYAGVHGGHGNYVRLEHGGGLDTGYAHMSRFAVGVGERVQAGQVIGYVGMTGLTNGPHVHYEVYRDGRTVDPMSMHFAGSTGASKEELAEFRARLTRLLLVPSGAALKPLRIAHRH